jgi:hypothetical protein
VNTNRNRLNRVTKLLVLTAGVVVLGGSAIGGIAPAADRSTAPSSPTPTCTGDDDVAGDRHGDATAPEDGLDHHGGIGTDDRSTGNGGTGSGEPHGCDD